MAAIGIPVLIWGDRYYIFFAFAGILTALAAYEFRKMLKLGGKPGIIDNVITILFTLGVYAAAFFALVNSANLIWFVIAVLVTAMAFLVMYLFMDSLNSRDLGEMLLTVSYVAFGFASMAYLRQTGLWLVSYALLCAILTDTFAFLFGIRFGRHRLAEKISPKKSVEGAVAGLVLGGGLAALFAYLLKVFTFSFWIVLPFSFLLSAAAQIGDLIASKFKRNHDIKDFSNLIPGHGGILDRFDSWIFTSFFLTVVLLVLTAFNVVAI